MSWRLVAIGFGFALLTLIVLAPISDAIGKHASAILTLPGFEPVMYDVAETFGE